MSMETHIVLVVPHTWEIIKQRFWRRESLGKIYWARGVLWEGQERHDLENVEGTLFVQCHKQHNNGITCCVEKTFKLLVTLYCILGYTYIPYHN